jgi:hypothetical protein
MRRPLREHTRIVTLYQLKAAAKVSFSSAIDVFQLFGQHPSLFAEPDIHRAGGVLIIEMLDHHEEHPGSLPPFTVAVGDDYLPAKACTQLSSLPGGVLISLLCVTSVSFVALW